MLKMTMPEPYAVFVQNLHADYKQEQLELGYPEDQILDLADYSHTYREWLKERYEETQHG